MNQYLAMLKNQKTGEVRTAKTVIRAFGSNDSTQPVGFQEKTDPFGSNGSTSPARLAEKEKLPFDAEYWGRKIEHSTRKAMQQDNGALAYCELFMPLLYRRYMKAANNLDAAYTAQCGHDRAELVTDNVTGLKEALRAHDRAAEQTRKAAAQPLTADQLNPAECSRFCQAHLPDKGGECSYLNQLNGCILWDAKNRRHSISELPISPTKYLEGHQREEP